MPPWLGRGLTIQPPWYKDHLAFKATFAYSQRWSSYQGSTITLFPVHSIPEHKHDIVLGRASGLEHLCSVNTSLVASCKESLMVGCPVSWDFPTGLLPHLLICKMFKFSRSTVQLVCYPC